MKKQLIFLAALLWATTLAAQNPSAYFMEGTTQRSQLNPAFAPLRGYINLPGLGGINAQVNGNLALDHMLYPYNGQLVTLLDNSVSAAEALDGLHAINQLGADFRINLIGFGAFTRNHLDFWSFDLNLRTQAEVNLPYSLFEFIKLGRQGKIRDIGIAADSYLEAGFNYSFSLLQERLYLGFRVKMLFGAARAQLYYDRFDVTLNEVGWQVDAAGKLDITAANVNIDALPNADGQIVYKPGDLNYKPKAPAGYGFAVDLGASYDILPNLQASLAVNDLGFIGWSKGHNTTGQSAKQLTFTGIVVDQNGTTTEPNFDLDLLEFTQTAAQSHTKMLHANIHAGLEYEVWRHKIGLGLLYTAQFRQYKTYHNLTGSVNFHPIRWFTLTGSYSVINNRSCAVGLAMNLCPNWINFYVATDMLTSKHTPQWIPISQHKMHVTFGMGIPIGRRSHRIDAYIRDCDRR